LTEFLKRTISGIIFVVTITGALVIGHVAFFIVFLGLMVATQYEFYKMTFKTHLRPQILLGLFIGIALFSWSFLYSLGKVEQITIFGFIPLLGGIFVVELYRNQHKPIQNIAVTLLGIIYIAVPLSLVNFIVINGSSTRISYSPNILLGLLFLIWSNDTGAYLLGVSMGKHKLFPRISPKKTWEGFVGGLLLTMIVSWVDAIIFPEVNLKHWFVIGFTTAIIGTFGDLVESMFKRSIGVKDSGKFLPSHGGFLDRFDAFLLVIPFIYAYLEVMILI
jgi:phosphatidate cytidylyltransferase